MEAIEVKKLILVSIVLLLSVHTAFAKDFTEYELAELLTDKAIADQLIEAKAYSEDDILAFVEENNFFQVHDKNATVSTEQVSQALADYETKKTRLAEMQETLNIIEIETGNDNVDAIVREVLKSESLEPISIEQLDQGMKAGMTSDYNKDEFVVYSSGCVIENGELETSGDDPNLDEARHKILDVARLLAAHAEKNNMVIGIKGGGTGMCVMYGESWELLRKDQYMFSVVYKRQNDFSMNKEVEGQVYSFDREVKIKDLYANKRLNNEIRSIEESQKWCETYVGVEEDVVTAYYEALKLLNKESARPLLIKTVNDYVYSIDNEYPDASKNETFTYADQFFYKEDVRSVMNWAICLVYNYMK